MDRTQQWPPLDLVRDFLALQRKVKRLELTARGSGWYDYISTWSAASTAPVLGTGVIDGRYQRIGSACNVQIELKAGTTTTFGSGRWGFSLPFTAKAPTLGGGFVCIGSAVAYDDSAGGGYPGIVMLDVVAGVATAWCTSAGPSVNSGSPFAWANQDLLLMEATYQVTEG